MANVSNFTQLRSWGCGEDSEITLNDVKMMFQNMISVPEYKLYIINDTADGSEVFHNSEFPVLRLCSENPAYMNIYICCRRQCNHRNVGNRKGGANCCSGSAEVL